jgi:hypothetical protein
MSNSKKASVRKKKATQEVEFKAPSGSYAALIEAAKYARKNNLKNYDRKN